MDVKKPRDYKKATMAAILVTIAALAVTVGAQAMRQERVVPTQGTPHENNSSYYTPNPSASQESSGASTQEEDGPYRIALYEGKIGVFQEGETEPYLLADVSVYLLPEEDIALLRRGISAENLTEVRRILEDYN